MAKTVLITGSSTGLGRATAHQFARGGWNVVATMRDVALAGDLERHANVLVTRLDVQNPNTIEGAIAEGIGRFGAIDAVVNNAGFALFGAFEGTPPDQIAEQFDVNVFGVMNVTRAILPHFRDRRVGVIVNISSAGGAIGMPLLSLYCASKFALEGFSETLSYELAPLGIAVKIVEIGIVPDTSFNAKSVALLEQSNPHEDYASYVSDAAAFFVKFQAQATASSAQVASAIVAATSDAGPQLRYVLTEDIAPLLAVRREASEEAYMATMRGLCTWGRHYRFATHARHRVYLISSSGADAA